ncbi:MAG: hypothetical protein HZY79_10170 [Rhodoblastus sp.]|nr:MAG: hypothetical protein HZY79_10170 [Rhodoblastus sp.]
MAAVYDAAAAIHGDAFFFAARDDKADAAPAIDLRDEENAARDMEAPDVAIDPATVAVHDATARPARKGLLQLLPLLGRRAA